MNTLLKLYILISCVLFVSCQADEKAIDSPKMNLTITNNFDLLEMLTSDFGVPLSNNKMFRGNEIKAIARYNFYSSSWFVDGSLISNENIDSLKFKPISNHGIGHKGSFPRGYENYNLTMDTSMVTQNINLENYRESGDNRDFSSPFNREFGYSGNYTYISSDGVVKDLRIADSVFNGDYLLFVDLSDNCIPNFFITNYGGNGFYSDFHTDFLCDGFYDAMIYGIYVQGKLEMKIMLDGENTDGKRIQKQIEYNAER